MGIPILEREEGSNLMCHPEKRELNLIASKKIQFLNVFENNVTLLTKSFVLEKITFSVQIIFSI